MKSPKIAVIVNMYNMRREAKRTLYSLTSEYQLGVNPEDYEVYVVDNGSDKPLGEALVKSIDERFNYLYLEKTSDSPCVGLNKAVEATGCDHVMCCIDGARILSPGILKYTLNALQISRHPFVYTIGMHIGSKPQNFLVEKGYNQSKEDTLIATTNWKENGYELFDISCPVFTCQEGYYSKQNESNCITLRRDDYLEIGGFDEKFTSPGGGLTNLDIFNRLLELDKIQPVLLLGEATFHQFHGGVATNVKMEDHPFPSMCEEYKMIRKKEYKPFHRDPLLLGWLSKPYHQKLTLGA